MVVDIPAHMMVDMMVDTMVDRLVGCRMSNRAKNTNHYHSLLKDKDLEDKYNLKWLQCGMLLLGTT
jgi:hypothetical protein